MESAHLLFEVKLPALFSPLSLSRDPLPLPRPNHKRCVLNDIQKIIIPATLLLGRLNVIVADGFGRLYRLLI